MENASLRPTGMKKGVTYRRTLIKSQQKALGKPKVGGAFFAPEGGYPFGCPVPEPALGDFKQPAISGREKNSSPQCREKPGNPAVPGESRGHLPKRAAKPSSDGMTSRRGGEWREDGGPRLPILEPPILPGT